MQHSFGGRIVQLIVGPEEKVLSVHEGLVSASPFFKAALSGKWKEGQMATIRLPEDDPETVHVYLNWVYGQNIEGFLERTSNGEEFRALSRAYVLGEKLLDPHFKNQIIDALIAHFFVTNNFPDGAAVTIIYNGTPKQSKAREALLDLFIWYAHEMDEDARNVYPKEFLHDLMNSLLHKCMPTSESPFRHSGRQHHHYHEH